MTTVICNVENCPYRSKNPLKKYKNSDGSKCYQCKLDIIIITSVDDCDGEIFGLLGYTPAECRFYRTSKELQE